MTITRTAGQMLSGLGPGTLNPGDDEILAQAYREGRVLVRLDKDFGELDIVQGQPHAGIIRLVNWSAHRQAEICLTVLIRYGVGLQAGAIVRLNLVGFVSARQMIRLPPLTNRNGPHVGMASNEGGANFRNLSPLDQSQTDPRLGPYGITLFPGHPLGVR